MLGAVNVAKTRLKLAALLSFCVFLAACTPSPLIPTIAYQPTTTDKTVTLLTPYVQPSPTLTSLAPITVVGALGGILGAAYDQSVQKDHATAFDALLTQEGFSAGPILQQDITRQLQAEGYTVQSLSVDRPTADFLTDYPGTKTDADLDLDVALVSLGYFKLTLTSPYEPIVEMKYRLVRAGSGDVLAQGVFQYSVFRGDEHPDPKYDIWHYSDFAASPGIAVTNLSEVLDQGAGAIAAGLH